MIRTRTLQVHVISIFFLPIGSQSINLNRGMMIIGAELDRVQTISKFSPGMESICYFTKQNYCQTGRTLQVRVVSTFSASAPPFVERQIVIRRLLSGHEMWFE